MSGWDRLNRGRRLLEEAEHNKYQRRIIEKERLQKTNELQRVVDGVQRESDAQLLELALRGGGEAAAREIYGKNSEQKQLMRGLQLFLSCGLTKKKGMRLLTRRKYRINYAVIRNG